MPMPRGYDPDNDGDRDRRRGPDIDQPMPTVHPPRHHPTAHEPIKPAPMRGPKQGNKGY